jgi:hypothetical protein
LALFASAALTAATISVVTPSGNAFRSPIVGGPATSADFPMAFTALPCGIVPTRAMSKPSTSWFFMSRKRPGLVVDRYTRRAGIETRRHVVGRDLPDRLLVVQRRHALVRPRRAVLRDPPVGHVLVDRQEDELLVVPIHQETKRGHLPRGERSGRLGRPEGKRDQVPASPLER